MIRSAARKEEKKAVTPLDRPNLPEEGSARTADSLASLRALVLQEHQRHWGVFGFRPEWSFELKPMAHLEGENAGKYLVSFFSKEGAPQKTVFLKRYHHPQIDAATIENEFQGIRIAHEAFAPTPRFRVPQPYGRLPEEKILFMEYCPSVSLKKVLFRPIRLSRFFLLHRDRKRLVESVAEAGRLLAAFQGIPPERHPSGGKETGEEIVLRYERQCLRHLQLCRKAGVPESLVIQMERSLFRRLEQGGGLQTVLQHSDFAPWNVMVGARSFYLTDFQNCTTGLAGYDAAFFHCALELLLRYRTADHALIAELQSIFLSEFLRSGSAGKGGQAAPAAEAMEVKERLPCFDLFRLMHMTYFTQSVFCAPPGPSYETFYAVPLRKFMVDWFQHYLEG
ncbi:MAG: aminoglycoside phosphotransferase family protein [Nitrospirae bacterium]|nr:aminoglycoside phosphotransferase family protein [Candidatus Manganitrophaceae bacterium]